MTNKLIRIGSTYTVPAVPYQPARPAYTSVETVYGRTTPAQAGGWVIARRQVFPTGSGSSGPYYVEERLWMPATPASQQVFSITTHHPATPEVQGSGARRVDIPPQGWTSFARSRASMASGYAEFTAREGNAGVAIGLSTMVNPTPGYGHIPHGLLLSNGTVRNLRTGADLGSYTATDVLRIAVQPQGVTFKKNGIDIGSDPNSYAPGARMYLSAVMYGALDFVENPVLVADPSGTSFATFPKAAALSADFDYSESVARFPKLEATSLEPEGGTANFPKMAAFSSDALGSGSSLATFPAATAYSYGGTLVVVPDSDSFAQFPKAEAASLLLVGGTGESFATFPKPFGISADYAYGESFAAFPKAEAYSYDESDPSLALLLDGVVFDVPMSAGRLSNVTARDAFAFDILMTADRVSHVEARDAFTFDVVFSVTGEQMVDARDVFWFDVPMLLASDSAGDAWAVNLDGFGSTTYSGYPFNSFANIGGRYFGAAITGIHELDGDTDAGAPIRASVDFGEIDFGNSFKKTVAACYLGMSSTGYLFIKILAEGQEFIYRTQGYSEHMQQQRVILGKGLRPNYAGLQLFNDDGADFALDSVEFVPVTMTRRI